MKTAGIILIVLGLAFARGNAESGGPEKLETMNAKNIAKSTQIDTASSNPESNILRYHPDQIQGRGHQDFKHSQIQKADLHQEDQARHLSKSQGHPDLFFHQDERRRNVGESFDENLQRQQHQMQPIQNQFGGSHYGAQAPVADFPSRFSNQNDQAIHRYQQEINQAAIVRDQEQNSHHQFPGNEPGFYQDRRTVFNVEDMQHEQNMDNEMVRRQITRGVHATEIRDNSVPKTFAQFSSGSKVPLVSQAHSSVLVPGMKSVPVVPALVYNSGAFAPVHSLAYAPQPVYRTGAYVRQHVQTPYSRYFYTQIL